MVKRIGTIRRKTRHKLGKKPREKGKISIRSYFQKYAQGERVVLKTNPTVHKGLYHPRFYGKTGKVVGMTGECCRVKINDQGKEKTLIVHPVHLKKV